MAFADLLFLAIVALIVGLIAWSYPGPKKRRHYPGSDDNGRHMRPERNDDGQGGGGFD